MGAAHPTASASKWGKKSDSHEIHGAESSGCLATVSPCPRVTCATPTSTATRSSSSPRTTCGRRRSTAAAPTASPPTAVPVARPRISPDGALVAWTSTRERAPEVFVTEVEGGAARRLTWWGDPTTKLIGWTPEGEVLAVSAAGQPSRRHPWAHVIPATGGTPRRLPLGPLADLAQRAEGPAVLLSATMTREMAWQKRYRGGTAGKLWWNPEGTFVRLAADLDGNLDAPMLVGDRIAFLSDHEGWGNLYSLDGRGPTCAATPTTAPTARPRSTPGTPPPTAPAWSTSRPGSSGCSTTSTANPGCSTSGSAAPAPPASPTASRRASGWAACARDTTGRSSVVGVRGTVHRLTHRDGPARALQATPGVRARLARRWARTARCGWTTRSARTPLHRPARPRAPERRDAAVAASSAACWSSCPRPTARASPSPPTTGACSCSTMARVSSASWPAAATARSTTSRSPRTARGWPTATRWARASRRSSSCGWKTARRCRSPRAASATPTRCSRSTASTSRSSRCAASTRSTTSTPSTSRSPPPGGRSSCRSARARRRRSGASPDGRPVSPRGRQAGGPTRARPSDPGDETEEAPSKKKKKDGAAGGGRRRRGARRAGRCRSRSSRAATTA